MATALVPPTKSAHPTYEKCPSNLRKVPIRHTKNAHPTYEKCPSDLQKVHIRPTKSAHLTYICTKLIGRLTATINYFHKLLRYGMTN